MGTQDINDSGYRDMLLKELNGIEDLELLILKGHILIEYSLNKFINDINNGGIDIDKTNFTFYSKISIAELLGLFKANDHLKESIVMVNRLRNQIAHNLSFDKSLLKKIISIYVKLNVHGSRIKKGKTDFENFYYIVIAICGLTIGKKMANQKIKKFSNQKLSLLRNENPEGFDAEFKNYGK